MRVEHHSRLVQMERELRRQPDPPARTPSTSRARLLSLPWETRLTRLWLGRSPDAAFTRQEEREAFLYPFLNLKNKREEDHRDSMPRYRAAQLALWGLLVAWAAWMAFVALGMHYVRNHPAVVVEFVWVDDVLIEVSSDRALGWFGSALWFAGSSSGCATFKGLVLLGVGLGGLSWAYRIVSRGASEGWGTPVKDKMAGTKPVAAPSKAGEKVVAKAADPGIAPLTEFSQRRSSMLASPTSPKSVGSFHATPSFPLALSKGTIDPLKPVRSEDQLNKVLQPELFDVSPAKAEKNRGEPHSLFFSGLEGKGNGSTTTTASTSSGVGGLTGGRISVQYPTEASSLGGRLGSSPLSRLLYRGHSATSAHYPRPSMPAGSRMLTTVGAPIWSLLGFSSASMRASAMRRLEERLLSLATDLIHRVDSCDRWLRQNNFMEYDSTHSLEEAVAAGPTFGTTGGGFGTTGGGFGTTGGGFGTTGGGFGTTGGGFRGTGFGAAASPSALPPPKTKKEVLLAQREQYRSQGMRPSAGPSTGFGTAAGTGGFSSFGGPNAAAVGAAPVLTPAAAAEASHYLQERIDLGETYLNVFSSFPIESGRGGLTVAERVQQQQHLLRRLRGWVSAGGLGSETGEEFGSTGRGGIVAGHYEEGLHVEGESVRIRSDAHLALHVLRTGLDGFDAFVRLGYSSRPESATGEGSSGSSAAGGSGGDLCLCVGDIGVPYFYVLYKAAPMDLVLDRSTGVVKGAFTGPSTAAGGKSPSKHRSKSKDSPRRVSVPGWLMRLQDRRGDSQAVRGANPSTRAYLTGIGDDTADYGLSWSEMLDEEEQILLLRQTEADGSESVILPTKPGGLQSLWEAMLLLIGIVHRFHGGVYDGGLKGRLDLARSGLQTGLLSMGFDAPRGAAKLSFGSATFSSGMD